MFFTPWSLPRVWLWGSAVNVEGFLFRVERVGLGGGERRCEKVKKNKREGVGVQSSCEVGNKVRKVVSERRWRCRQNSGFHLDTFSLSMVALGAAHVQVLGEEGGGVGWGRCVGDTCRVGCVGEMCKGVNSTVSQSPQWWQWWHCGQHRCRYSGCVTRC